MSRELCPEEAYVVAALKEAAQSGVYLASIDEILAYVRKNYRSAANLLDALTLRQYEICRDVYLVEWDRLHNDPHNDQDSGYHEQDARPGQHERSEQTSPERCPEDKLVVSIIRAGASRGSSGNMISARYGEDEESTIDERTARDYDITVGSNGKARVHWKTVSPDNRYKAKYGRTWFTVRPLELHESSLILGTRHFDRDIGNEELDEDGNLVEAEVQERESSPPSDDDDDLEIKIAAKLVVEMSRNMAQKLRLADKAAGRPSNKRTSEQSDNRAAKRVK